MTWKKIVTEASKKYYYTVQNISVIPNSKVYLKITNVNRTPDNTTGAIILTSKNYLSSVLPTNSYMYVAEEGGAIAGTIVSEVITQTNFNIETVHENRTLTTTPSIINVPKGALFVLQNVSANDIQYKIQNTTGRGVLTTNQIFAIAFAKDTKVSVSGRAGSEFSYIITSSVNMTALDPILQADIDYIKAHLKTVNTRYVSIEALEQLQNQLGRGSFTEELAISGNNTRDHVFDTVKLNPIDSVVTEIKDRSIIEVIGDIQLTNSANRSVEKSSFSFTVNVNPDDTYSINDIFVSNKEVRKAIDKIFIRRSNTKDKIQLILNTTANYESRGKFKIRISGYKLVKDTPLGNAATRAEVTYKHDNLEFFTDADRNEISSNLVENVNASTHTKENFTFVENQSSPTKIWLNLQGRIGVVLELNEAAGELIVYLGKSHYNGFQANNIYRIYTIGDRRGLTASFPIKLFSAVNSNFIREDGTDSIKYRFPLHRFTNVNRSFEFYKDYFRKIYNRMKAAANEKPLSVTSSINIRYD